MLTVFIGGYAVGNLIAGKLTNKQHSLNFYLLLYIIIELLTSAYAFCIPWLLGHKFFEPIWSFLAFSSLNSFYLASLMKFVFISSILSIPAILLGCGFPILSEILSKESKNLNLSISNLYATNNLGAIAGAFLTGFFLLEHLGQINTIRMAALINLITAIALIIYLVFSYRKHRNKNQADNKTGTSISYTLRKLHGNDCILLILVFLLGFINLGLEILWTKVLGLVIGSSAYSLTIIIASVLTGISIGGYLLNTYKLHSANIKKTLLLLQTLFVLALILSTTLFNKLPTLILILFKHLSITCNYYAENLIKFLTAACIILPVTILEGIIVSLVFYLFSNNLLISGELQRLSTGLRVALVSSINTIGAIAGSFAMGFIILPIFSYTNNALLNSFRLMIACSILTLAYLLFIKDSYHPKRNIVVTLIIIILGASLSIPKINPQELSSGTTIYRSLKYKHLDINQFSKSIKQPILFHREARHNIITVIEDHNINTLLLKSNGKVEAGLVIDPNEPSQADMITQVLLADIPVLLNQNISNSLLIGMGSGVTLNSLVSSIQSTQDTAFHVDVCEIEPDIYEAVDQIFKPKIQQLNGAQYLDNENINRFSIDARTFLLAQKYKAATNYDLIISQPSDPWISSALFTVEFWDLAASKLTTNGLFVQWLQLYSIEPKLLATALKTFESVFPEILIFRPGSAAELILIGSRSPIDINLQTISKKINTNLLKRELVKLGIRNEADLLANLILPSITTKRLISQINHPQINTDDNMILEFNTLKNIGNFSETIKANEKFLLQNMSSKDILELFAEAKDKSFLHRLIESHNNLVQADYKNNYSGDMHGKIAQELAEEIFSFNKSPASFLNLYNIYNKQLAWERVDSILYESDSLFSDYSSENPSKPEDIIIFSGLMPASLFDTYQLNCLAQLHAYNKSFPKALSIINKAIKDFRTTINSYQLSELFLTKANILFNQKRNNLNNGNLQVDLDLIEAYDNYNESLKYNKLNYQAQLGLANLFAFKMGLLKYNWKGGIDNNKFLLDNLNKSILAYKQAIAINPNYWPSYLALAKLYLSLLPQSEIEFFTSNEKYSTEAIHYLKDTLTLEPNQVEANYEMAILQYRIGNLDLAYLHLSKIINDYDLSIICQEVLGLEKFEKAQALYKKIKAL